MTGGVLLISYNNNTTESIDMDLADMKVSGFNNKNVGKVTITLTYKEKTTTFDVNIIKEENAKNSNLDNAKSITKQVKAYYFTDNSTKDYTLIDIEINNISRNLNNDKVEYYYYLSTVQNEENITEWVKITDDQNSNDNLRFTINSKDISNYEDISKENVLYIYIKEVAIKGGDQSAAVTEALSLENSVKVETFVDGVKKEEIKFNYSYKNNNSNDEDKTIATGGLPQTGVATIIYLILVIIIVSIFYFKYNKLKDIKY